ncbi:MAG TPA: PaaI family thioesterase [Dehalococcoidia bacterium]|nr:PaaI family thioesterase [Dehalococcoidia bacterium]
MSGPSYAQALFTEFIGARVERVDEGTCLLSLTVEPRHLDRRSGLHSGVLTSLMDATIGIGLGYLRRDEVRHRPHATIEMNASFLADGRQGDEIEVEGRVIPDGPYGRQGRSIAFGEAVARRRPDGEVLALSRLTFAIAAHRHPSAAQGPSPGPEPSP